MCSPGLPVDRLDNPGWTVAIDLEEATLSGRPYERTGIRRSDSGWVMATVSDDVFQASRGPVNPREVLRLFRDWATSVSDEP
ncbi:immunity 53 family protein [Streptomyces koelreuteriae]|uniref:Immunity 53 family protein n=1 Tax=Streptomyces koelreuteriae TaxID=2838015 RepID=A0ABX8FV73_9ACTN|nr:immunity 53 family protein [Streptomyces koelreuteriae]